MANILMSWGMAILLFPMFLLLYMAMGRSPLDSMIVSFSCAISALILGVMDETRVRPVLQLIGILAIGLGYGFLIQHSMEECWAEKLLNFL